MAGSDRLARGVAVARHARAEIGREVREARLNAGLSQISAARAVRMSHAQLGRIERGELRRLSVEQASRACAAVGLKLVVRAYPDGEPIRDAAQVALLRRFRALLPTSVRWQTEVPLPIAGDGRSWDVVLTFVDALVAVEAKLGCGMLRP
jgi:transcriptional regulator with XRE-family HTH domain